MLPKCEVNVFGSQATGLCLPTSDIDIVIQLTTEDEDATKNADEQKQQGNTSTSNSNDIKSEEEEEEDHKEPEEWQDMTSKSPLDSLAEALRHQWKEDLTYLEVIPNTRVPLVKFTHGPTNISIDVSFDKGKFRDSFCRHTQSSRLYNEFCPLNV